MDKIKEAIKWFTIYSKDETFKKYYIEYFKTALSALKTIEWIEEIGECKLLSTTNIMDKFTEFQKGE